MRACGFPILKPSTPVAAEPPSLRSKLSTSNFRISAYISGHGYGHLVRSGELFSELASRQALTLEVVTDGPWKLWPRELRPISSWREQPCDVGVVQKGEFSVDRQATFERLRRWRHRYRDLVEAEAARLRSHADVVFGDLPPLAFDAAALAQIPSVGMANFSWDWIYEQMGFFEDANAAARAYACADMLIELSPGAPMRAFAHRVDGGLLGRRASASRAALGQAVGAKPSQAVILVSLRSSWTRSFSFPATGDEVLYLFDGEHADHPCARMVPDGWRYVDVVGASDAVVTKPGYGIIGDCSANGVRMLYALPDGFPEHRVLHAWLRKRPGCSEISAQQLETGRWREDLYALLEASPPAPEPGAGGARAASLLDAFLKRAAEPDQV